MFSVASYRIQQLTAKNESYMLCLETDPHDFPLFAVLALFVSFVYCFIHSSKPPLASCDAPGQTRYNTMLCIYKHLMCTKLL